MAIQSTLHTDIDFEKNYGLSPTITDLHLEFMGIPKMKKTMGYALGKRWQSPSQN